MTPREFYASIAVDYDKLLQRLRKEDRVAKYLRQAMDDTSFAQLREAMEAKDFQAMFRAAHTIKGMCLNLDLEPLSSVASDLVERLRGGGTVGAEELCASLLEQYAMIKEKVNGLDE